MRILKNICEEKNWKIVRPSLFINSTQTVIIVDVYEVTVGSIYHVYVDTEHRYYKYQFLSPFSIHTTFRLPLDKYM